MRFIYLLLFLLLTMSSAQAREEFWYAGAGAGATYVDDDAGLYEELDNKGAMYKVYGGYRVSTYIALELEYADYGDYNYRIRTVRDEISYKSLTASIVVMYPLIWDEIELFTPIGGSAVYTDYGRDSKTFGAYKLGFGMVYTPESHKEFSLRLGWDVLVLDVDHGDDDKKYKQNISSFFATVQYNF
jgi:hypothetical protein